MLSKKVLYLKLACIFWHKLKASVRSINNCGPGLFVFVVLLLFTGCSCKNPIQPPADKTLIKGTVTDSLTGQPLAGTVVSLSTGLSATTDNNGNYQLTGMGGGSFTMQYEKYDWRRKSKQVSVAANYTLTVDTMRLDSCRWVVVPLNLSMPWAAGYLEDVCFVNENEGWAVGSDQSFGYPGYIIRTTDGGYTWEMQFGAQPIDGWYFHNIDFVDNLYGWAIAAADQMKRTTNGGTTWIDITKPFYGSGWAMDFIDRNTGWIAQYYGGGGIYKTSDGGNTWIKMAELPDSALCSMKFLDANRGWMRSSNKVYATVDGGNTWTLQMTKPYSGAGQDSKIEVLPPGNIWVEGYHSRDGGITWSKQNSDTFGVVSAISFCNENYGWMAAKKDVYEFFIHTIDGGQTWVKVNPLGNFYYILVIQFLNPYCGWAAGDNDKMLIYK